MPIQRAALKEGLICGEAHDGYTVFKGAPMLLRR